MLTFFKPSLISRFKYQESSQEEMQFSVIQSLMDSSPTCVEISHQGSHGRLGRHARHRVDSDL